MMARPLPRPTASYSLLLSCLLSLAFLTLLPADRAAAQAPVDTYTVQSGDTLASIATLFGIAWEELAAANEITARPSCGLGKSSTCLKAVQRTHSQPRVRAIRSALSLNGRGCLPRGSPSSIGQGQPFASSPASRSAARPMPRRPTRPCASALCGSSAFPAASCRGKPVGCNLKWTVPASESALEWPASGTAAACDQAE